MQSLENNWHVSSDIGVYGTIRQGGLQALFNNMFNGNITGIDGVFIDMGAGIGRPGVVAWALFGCSTVVNVEFDSSKLQLLQQFHSEVVTRYCQ